MNTPAISGRRLLVNLNRLASFGARPDGGVDRVAGSLNDLAARKWLAQYLHSCGLQPETDDIGNVFGRTRHSQGPWILAGSHSDTVPAGGKLDGAYGVIAAIECLQTLHESGHPAADLLQVVSFWDEEGAQPDSSGGLVGSSAFLKDSSAKKKIRAFLELHIEQGPRMESSGLELCVVDGIVGVDRHEISMYGVANHGGTTPFERRHDAGRALVRAAATVNDLIRIIDRDLVGNVGFVSFDPGAPNVIPGSARMIVELRAPSEKLLKETIDGILTVASRTATEEGCIMEHRPLSQKPVTHFDPGLRALLDAVCTATGCRSGHMVSYAGHDSAVMATRVPTAMLFVPSTNGVSHAPGEKTPDRLLVQGAQALLDAIVRYARDRPASAVGRAR